MFAVVHATAATRNGPVNVSKVVPVLSIDNPTNGSPR
jgi:hypothetical protein